MKMSKARRRCSRHFQEIDRLVGILFLLRVNPAGASFELNGESVIPEFPTKRYVRCDVDGRLALVVSHRDSEIPTRITALETRKLPGGEP